MSKEVLVLGGTGFVGRNLVVHLLERHGERILIRVADKCPPAMAFLSQEYKRAFDDDRVEFVQCDLTRKCGIDKGWTRDGGRWDIVVNLAAETGDGRDEALYEKRCAGLSAMNAERAGEEGPDLYIEMSTAFVYASSFRAPNDEQARTNPITLQGKWKLKGEEVVREGETGARSEERGVNPNPSHFVVPFLRLLQSRGSTGVCSGRPLFMGRGTGTA